MLCTVRVKYIKQGWRIVHHFNQFCWLSALLPTKLAKFLVLILKLLTSNEFKVKDSFHFVEEIVDQQPDFFMGSLDVDSHTLRGYHLYLHK